MSVPVFTADDCRHMAVLLKEAPGGRAYYGNRMARLAQGLADGSLVIADASTACETCRGAGRVHVEPQTTGVPGGESPCPDCQPLSRADLDVVAASLDRRVQAITLARLALREEATVPYAQRDREHTARRLCGLLGVAPSRAPQAIEVLLAVAAVDYWLAFPESSAPLRGRLVATVTALVGPQA